MTQNYRNSPVTRISTSDRESVTVRGLDLCDDIMGKMSFSEYFYFLVTGQRLSVAKAQMLDALLVSIAEHGVTPTSLTARMTIAAEPDSLQGAVAAGILGCGSVVLGSSAECAKVLEEIVLNTEGDSLAVSAKVKARALYEVGAKIPGFGHNLHKPNDPRAVRLLSIADDLGISGQYVAALRALTVAVNEVWAKHVVLNIQGPIAAIALDMGMSSFMAKSIPLLARTAGVIGHVNEEMDEPFALNTYLQAAGAIKYVGSDD